MTRRRWSALPPAPVNVRLVDRETGETFPVELAYQGQDQEGIDCWLATTMVALDVRRPFMLRADLMPPKCSIEVAVGREGG
jgi:hypothetical protein